MGNTNTQLDIEQWGSDTTEAQAITLNDLAALHGSKQVWAAWGAGTLRLNDDGNTIDEPEWSPKPAIRITQLTKTDSGTYDESGDMAPDMFDGQIPETIDDIRDWLRDESYRPVDGFKGWGEVFRHEDTGEIISVKE